MSQIATAPEPTSAADLPARPGLWLPALSLWRREMVRFFRQRNRVIGAMATPLVFWLLMGFGLDRSFVGAGGAAADGASGVGYLEYFFPGTVVLVLLFTAIFSTISVIEDRREGFMQAVLVSPIPRLSIVLGKVLGGATIATIQGVLFLLLWPLIADHVDVVSMLLAVPVMFIVAAGLTALGLMIAWPMDSTAGFHAIMNLLLMPMWFLSGAVFPVDGAPAAMSWIMRLNPLTYGQSTFGLTLSGAITHPDRASGWTSVTPAPMIDLTVCVVVTLISIGCAAALVRRPRRDGSA